MNIICEDFFFWHLAITNVTQGVPLIFLKEELEVILDGYNNSGFSSMKA